MLVRHDNGGSASAAGSVGDGGGVVVDAATLVGAGAGLVFVTIGLMLLVGYRRGTMNGDVSLEHGDMVLNTGADANADHNNNNADAISLAWDNDVDDVSTISTNHAQLTNV